MWVFHGHFYVNIHHHACHMPALRKLGMVICLLWVQCFTLLYTIAWNMQYCDILDWVIRRGTYIALHWSTALHVYIEILDVTVHGPLFVPFVWPIYFVIWIPLFKTNNSNGAFEWSISLNHIIFMDKLIKCIQKSLELTFILKCNYVAGNKEKAIHCSNCIRREDTEDNSRWHKSWRWQNTCHQL